MARVYVQSRVVQTPNKMNSPLLFTSRSRILCHTRVSCVKRTKVHAESRCPGKRASVSLNADLRVRRPGRLAVNRQLLSCTYAHTRTHTITPIPAQLRAAFADGRDRVQGGFRRAAQTSRFGHRLSHVYYRADLAPLSYLIPNKRIAA
jgi:hypothetical protein